MSNKNRSVFIAITLSTFALGLAACDDATPAGGAADDTIEQVYAGKLTVAQAQDSCRCRLEVVPIGGTVFHFGLDLSQSPPVPFPFQSTVAGARVSIAEAPITRLLGIRSDADGNWSFKAVKVKGTPLHVSFVYELAGYTIGAPYPLANVLVTTVGKAWASMYNPELPHGDPGAVVSIAPAVAFPASLGPVYFNEGVAPDPTLTSTSVDGGVLYGNLASGSYVVTASKAPFSYAALTFVVEDGITLYVASPPHATQGTNTSGPGQP